MTHGHVPIATEIPETRSTVDFRLRCGRTILQKRKGCVYVMNDSRYTASRRLRKPDIRKRRADETNSLNDLCDVNKIKSSSASSDLSQEIIPVSAAHWEELTDSEAESE
jgi:hypothetical protein